MVGILFPIFPLYLTLKATTAIACTFDKKLNLMTLKRKNWFGEKVVRHHLSGIRDIQLKVIDKNQDESDTYEVGIILGSGAYLCLNEPTTSFDRNSTESLVSTLKSFLDLRSGY